MLPGLGNETGAVARMLRMLLGAANAVMLVGAMAFLGADLVVGTESGQLALFLLIVVLGAIAAALYALEALSLGQLRALELLAFGAVATYLGFRGYQALTSRLAEQDLGAAISAWNLVLIQFLLLMVTYAAFVPNRWPRAAAVLAVKAAVPAAVVALIYATRADLGEAIARATATVGIVQPALILTVGFALTVLCAYVIHEYFQAAYDARASTMYTLKERIGAGGMGEVWLAEHNSLARPAAIKLIRGDRIGSTNDTPDRALKRFEREAKATAQLRSAHTIQIYDFGVTEEGTFFYAMEHLDGLDLEQLVERHGPLKPERVIYLLRQVCDSLADAHDRGMVHRDIKPANIYVCRLGPAYDFVKVLDFGLVKTTSKSKNATELTLEGMATGTPAYMAPEMAVDQGGIDGRADLYALGCVAYFLLTGKPVFEGEGPMNVIVDHVKTEPLPPSKKTEVPVPADLEAVIMKALSKRPADRFANAEEFSEALAACADCGKWSGRDGAAWWKLHLPQLAA